MTKAILPILAFSCGIFVAIHAEFSAFWIWAIIAIGLLMFLPLSCSDIGSNGRRRLERKALRRAVEKDCEYKGSWNDLNGLWWQVYSMHPGAKRSELRQSLLTLIMLDLKHENYWQHPLCLPFHWFYIYDCSNGMKCGEIICPQCGKTVHFAFNATLYNENIYATNEEEKTVLTWNGVPPADLPPGYHTDECPYCNHRPLDFFAEIAVNISLFRFLQDFTLILPDGKHVSLAETPPANAGKGAGE